MTSNFSSLCHKQKRVVPNILGEEYLKFDAWILSSWFSYFHSDSDFDPFMPGVSLLLLLFIIFHHAMQSMIQRGSSDARWWEKMLRMQDKEEKDGSGEGTENDAWRHSCNQLWEKELRRVSIFLLFRWSSSEEEKKEKIMRGVSMDDDQNHTFYSHTTCCMMLFPHRLRWIMMWEENRTGGTAK